MDDGFSILFKFVGKNSEPVYLNGQQNCPSCKSSVPDDRILQHKQVYADFKRTIIDNHSKHPEPMEQVPFKCGLDGRLNTTG